MQRLIEGDPRLRGIAFEDRLEIAIDGPDHHFFSPQLVVRVRPVADGSALDARFGPDPYVWALYLLGAGALSLVTLFAAIVGLGQWTVGQRPTALAVAPAAAALAALVYGASYVGQGLGSDQMYLLRHSLETAVEGREPDLANAR